jgi:putative flavoprotein involved in K+ transport
MTKQIEVERIQTVIIGGGQAGLSVGYHLAKRGAPFVILEGHARVGDSWRRRWNSLRLFTAAKFDGLDGLPFPGDPDRFPTKDEMADYLESYVRRFELPVRTGVKVDRVERRGQTYIITAAGRQIEAEHVVIAMASYQVPHVPTFAQHLAPEIVQLHSLDYRGPQQMQKGAVLIVGAGNSGSEIAMELSRDHTVCMAGRDTGHVPFRGDSFAGRWFLVRLVLRVLFHRLLTLDTPLGRKVRPKIIGQGGPLIRVKPKDLAAAGVQRVPRIAEIRNGRPVTDAGQVLDVANVVWCTGFHPGFSWIDLAVFDDRGDPKQTRGVVDGEPGLYFVGLHFLYAMSSTMIHGVGRDAEYLAERIAERVATGKVGTLQSASRAA